MRPLRNVTATRYTSPMTQTTTAPGTARHALADLPVGELAARLARATERAARTRDSARYRLALHQSAAIRAELTTR